MQKHSNFGRNVEWTPGASLQPKTIEEVLSILNSNPEKQFRAGGSLHAWSDGVISDEIYLDLKHIDFITPGPDGKSVRVGAGCQIKQLLTALKAFDLTLPTIGLIDEQTVAGATATGTHGSGKPCLSQFIESIEIAHFDRNGQATLSVINSAPQLQAAKCSLGLLGIVTAVTFECRPNYKIKEHLQKHATLKQVLNEEKRFPLQQFYLMPWSWDLYGHHRVESNEPTSRFAMLYQLYWSLIVDRGLHIILFLMVKVLRSNFLTRNFYRLVLPLVFVRNWNVVDEAHTLLTMNHELFRHIEIELFVRRQKLPAALEYVKETICLMGGVSNRKANTSELDHLKDAYTHHYPICVRRVESDNTFLSMASATKAGDDEDWYAISLISYHAIKNRNGFFEFANFLATSMAERFDARPHWGKYNPLTKVEVANLFPKLDEFRDIQDEFDPSRQFSNEWLKRTI